MIVFLVINRTPIEEFLEDWGRALRGIVVLHTYESLSLRRPFPPGLYVFSDLERLSPSERAFARDLAARLRQFPDRYRIANDPRQHRGRVELIRLLHEAGVNDFTAYYLPEAGQAMRFPVFIRREYDHWGVSPLLANREELQAALQQVADENSLGTRDVIIVEFSETTQEAGLFKKYSVFRFADRYVPRHILASPAWFTKVPDVIRADLCAEELEFVSTWAGDEALERAFHLAGVDYGRIDYGFKADDVRIWEINSNPTILPLRQNLAPERVAAQELSARKIVESFQQADFSPELGGVRLFTIFAPAVLQKAFHRAWRWLRRRLR